MALLPIFDYARNGVMAKIGAIGASGGDQLSNTGNEMIIAFNGTNTGAVLLVTVATLLVDGFKPPDRVVSVPAGEAIIFGPFPTMWYGPTPTVNYSFTADVLVKAIRNLEMTKL